MTSALIVGSAPDIRLPEERGYDFVIGVNGGARLAHDAGLRVDALVTTAYLCRGETEYSRYVLEGWRGLRVPVVYADIFWYEAITVSRALTERRVSYLVMVPIDRVYRGVLLRSATGGAIGADGEALGNGDLEHERCSTGVLAACLAAQFAQRITLAGFSRVHGHVGNLAQHENGRHHKADDAVTRLLAQRVELRTTSAELAEHLELARV